MIHFNFVVSDVDAENIFDAVHEFYIEALEKVLVEKAKPAPDQAKVDWLRNNARYIQSLKAKMTNSRVQDAC